MRSVARVATSVGPLHVVWDDDALGVDAAGRVCRGAVTRSWFGDTHLVHGPKLVKRPTGDLKAVIDAVKRWNAGEADALNPVPVLQVGSEFRQRVWQALRSVPGGDVITYQELAARAGSPSAVRAVGTAMAVNAVAPFVPCHRVVKTGGEIGNYAYGSEMKVELLVREGVIVD